MTERLTLISFATCPFVQRAVIALKEKSVPHEVIYVDLGNKPDWFLAISPLGKVPVLKVERDGAAPVHIFESAVILEYLEETAAGPKLHPVDALERARHRGFIEYASQTLSDNWKLTSAASNAELEVARASLRTRLDRLEKEIAGPFFAGETFSLVDAAFAPAFRQLDVLEVLGSTGLFEGRDKINAWRRLLADRPSVRDAVPADFADHFLQRLRTNHAAILDRAA